MSYFVRIPKKPGSPASDLDSEHYLNIINGDGTLIQRELRRRGYGGYEPVTAATMCAVFDLLDRGEVFERANDSAFSFFDVGANGGLYSFLCKSLFRDRCEVTAFEPAPDSYRWLSAINEVNHLDITTEAVAVSDNTDDVTLYLSGKSDASNSLNKDFRAHKGTVTVQCVTLDGYIETSKRSPDFLKIDTETHEEFVLRGGATFLRKNRPVVIIEAIKKGDIDYGTKIAEAFDDIGGYFYYHLGPDFTVTLHDTISTEIATEYRDWLVSPVQLSDEFFTCVKRWSLELSKCTVQTNVTKPSKKKPRPAAPKPAPKAETPRPPAGIFGRLQAAAKAFAGDDR